METELLQSIWENFSPQIVSGGISLLIALLLLYLRPKASLIWGQANHSWHTIPVNEDVESSESNKTNNQVNVISEKNFVQNLGKAPATDVEIVYQYPPTKLMIFPQRDYAVTKNPDGAHVVTLPYISPRELVTLDGIFINEPLGHILSVRCKEVSGKRVVFWVIQRLPNIVYNLIRVLIVLGFAFVVGIFLKVVGIA